MRRLPFLALSGLLVAGSAQAEFLLVPSGQAAPAAAVPTAGVDRIAVPPRPRPPSLPRAEGFGEGVPLHVAARQIVPPNTSVVWGEGVDRDAPVDWRGGRPWNLVLADTVKPLGLKLVRKPGQVTIGR